MDRLRTQIMWTDGPRSFEELFSLNEYELRHGCFGGDAGGEGDAAGNPDGESASDPDTSDDDGVGDEGDAAGNPDGESASDPDTSEDTGEDDGPAGFDPSIGLFGVISAIATTLASVSPLGAIGLASTIAANTLDNALNTPNVSLSDVIGRDSVAVSGSFGQGSQTGSGTGGSPSTGGGGDSQIVQRSPASQGTGTALLQKGGTLANKLLGASQGGIDSTNVRRAARRVSALGNSGTFNRPTLSGGGPSRTTTLG